MSQLTAADRLIVALDGPVEDMFDLVQRLTPRVRTFKLRARTFFHHNGRQLAMYIRDRDAELMLDLKAYDTPDSIAGDVEAVTRWLSPKFITVHLDCVEAAMRTRPEDGPLILAVNRLTNDHQALLTRFLGYAFDRADGVVCHPAAADTARRDLYEEKIIVCPGVRPIGIESNDHFRTITPAAAIWNGADYVVVGRPIWKSNDPVGVASRIIDEIEENCRA